MNTEGSSQWKNEGEKGNILGVLILVWFGRYLGRTITHGILFFICLFFFVGAKSQRQYSRDALTRIDGLKPALLRVFSHFYCFAKVSVDRIFFLRGETDKFELSIDGEELFDQLNTQDEAEGEAKGALLILSHIGSFDALRVAGNNKLKGRIKVLLDSNVSPNAMSILNALNPEMASNIIDRSLYTSTGLALKIAEEINQGCLVGIMADRLYGNEPSVEQKFLGDSAQFPLAPWTLALILKVPVILCFGTYSGANRYNLKFIQAPAIGPCAREQRNTIIEKQCSMYVGHLETAVRQTPLNWFNFYDFWNDEPSCS